MMSSAKAPSLSGSAAISTTSHRSHKEQSWPTLDTYPFSQSGAQVQRLLFLSASLLLILWACFFSMKKVRDEATSKAKSGGSELSSGRSSMALPYEDPLVEIPILDFDAIPAIAAHLAKTVEERPRPDHGFFVKGTDTPYSGVYYWVTREPDGDSYNVANVKDGQLEGTGTTYRPDGSKTSEVTFRNGERLEGTEKYWNRKGEELGAREEVKN